MTSLEFNDGDSETPFGLLAWGCLLAGFWVPFPRLAWLIQAVGCGLMGMALARLGPQSGRFAKAAPWAYGAMALSLIDAIAPPHNVLNRLGLAVNVPFTYFFADLALAGAIWQITAGFVDLAAQHKNTPLRAAAHARRDLFLLSLFLLTLTAGPLTALLAAGAVGPGFYRVAWWGAGLFQFMVMSLWFGLCRRAAGGLDPEPGVL